MQGWSLAERPFGEVLVRAHHKQAAEAPGGQTGLPLNCLHHHHHHHLYHQICPVQTSRILYLSKNTQPWRGFHWFKSFQISWSETLTQWVVIVQDGPPVLHTPSQRHEVIIVILIRLSSSMFFKWGLGVTETFIHDSIIIILIKQIIVVIGWFLWWRLMKGQWQRCWWLPFNKISHILIVIFAASLPWLCF